MFLPFKWLLLFFYLPPFMPNACHKKRITDNKLIFKNIRITRNFLSIQHTLPFWKKDSILTHSAPGRSYKFYKEIKWLKLNRREAVGEVRNWDYRFCWLRDASMSIETMFQIGHTGAAKRFMKFIQSTFVSKHDYQIIYGIRAEKKRKEKRRGYLLFWFKHRKPLDS